MASDMRRITFVITPEIEPLLDKIKQEMFYNCSQSEMIRTLIEAGWKTMTENKDRPNRKTG